MEVLLPEETAKQPAIKTLYSVSFIFFKLSRLPQPSLVLFQSHDRSLFFPVDSLRPTPQYINLPPR